MRMIAKLLAAHFVKWCILLAIVVVSKVAYGQTTIVAVRDRRTVVIAADSLFASADGSQQAKTGCKIHQCGSFYIGFAGPTHGQRFDPRALLRDACRNGGDARTMMLTLERAILPKFTELLTDLRDSDPTRYAAMSLHQELAAEVIMVGFEAGGPFMLDRFFPQPVNVTGRLEIIPIRRDHFQRVAKGSYEYRFVGHTQQIQELITTKNPFATLGLVRGSEFLVNHMIQARPQNVGPPVDILAINKLGANWIQRKRECEK